MRNIRQSVREYIFRSPLRMMRKHLGTAAAFLKRGDVRLAQCKIEKFSKQI